MAGSRRHSGRVLPKDETAGGEAEARPGGTLRILTCGSVDDGKSTLIGRLIYETDGVPEDQLAVLRRDSPAYAKDGFDFLLLLDGHEDQRAQGITINVAYQYFGTQRRTFMVADAPGHEQYTRNMATGASISDLAVMLVDARKGVLTQTRRHSSIIRLFGIEHVVLAINKMDLAGWSQQTFDAIILDYMAFAGRLGITRVTPIPLCATTGENVAVRSEKMAWYTGPTLLEHLETVDTQQVRMSGPMRLPVQLVTRPEPEVRAYAGSLAQGTVGVGQDIAVWPSGCVGRVARVLTPAGERLSVGNGGAVSVVLSDHIDVGRGDVIAARDSAPEVADQFAAHLVWMADEPMLPGRPYLLKCGAQATTATISVLKHKLDVDSLERVAGRQLGCNEIGFCNISAGRPLVFEAYDTNRAMGAFILIDKINNGPVAAGLIRFPLRRAANLHPQLLDITKANRAQALGQRPSCLWFTGLPASGKSTIANIVERRLHASGRHTYLLDGDNVRRGLTRDLGFTDADRVENIRRVAEVARLMTDAGLIVLVAFISPFRAERRMARELFVDGEFLEIFVDTPLEVCEGRDPKGLYRKARRGLLTNFTGIDSAYERPEQAELTLRSDVESPEQLAERVMSLLEERRRLKG